MFQSGPESEDVLARRALADGRVVAVFRDTAETVLDREMTQLTVAGGKVLRMPTMRARLMLSDKFTLVVTDNAEEPYLWRAVSPATTHLSREAALEAFAKFRPEDAERRHARVACHHRRRASDRQPPPAPEAEQTAVGAHQQQP